MDEEFFKKILRRTLGDETITNVTIKSKMSAGGKGTNYLSFIWRFNLGYCCIGTNEESGKLIEKDINLIVKEEPRKVGHGAVLVRNQNLFQTEVQMLEVVLPEIERHVGERLSPKYFGRLEDEGVIVMEDLTPLGFKTQDRQSGLSFNYVIKTIHFLAKLHAGSVKQCEENPEIIKSFTQGMMSTNTPQNLFRVLEKSLDMVIKKISHWSDPIYSRIAEKLEILLPKFANDIIKVSEYDDDEFCVLNHGDCWISNLMFRESLKKDKELEVMLVDYQMSVYSSPAVDLIHFLSVCLELDLACEKNDFFIEEYLRKLTKTMNLLGCKTQPPTFDDMQKAILKRRMIFVLGAIMFHPRMIANVSDIETLDEILEAGETNMDIFKNPKVTNFLQKVLPFLYHRGYLD